MLLHGNFGNENDDGRPALAAPGDGKRLQMVAEGVGLAKQNTFPGPHKPAGVSGGRVIPNAHRRVVRPTHPVRNLASESLGLLSPRSIFGAESLILVELAHFQCRNRTFWPLLG